jgi:tRNA(Arg) A34 adenosine deaminase TadA
MGAYNLGMTHEQLLLRAIELAERHSAAGDNGPFGAVIARGGQIVGEGWNQVVACHDPTAHAEIMAIRDAGRRLGVHHLADCVLYTSCEPCAMCLAAIYWARIDVVYYAATMEDADHADFDDGAIYAELAQPWSKRRIDGFNLLRQRGRQVFEQWLANPDRIAY